MLRAGTDLCSPVLSQPLLCDDAMPQASAEHITSLKYFSPLWTKLWLSPPMSHISSPLTLKLYVKLGPQTKINEVEIQKWRACL